MADTERLRKIVSLLPGKNCGKCGFENCGQFAVALAEGKAKPTACRKCAPRLPEICAVLGIEAPSEEELKAMGRRWGRHGHKWHHLHMVPRGGHQRHAGY